MTPSAPDLGKFDAVLIDLDGTFYREDEGGVRVLPGAVELVRRLEREGRKYACLTNSGSSPGQLARKVAEMGATVGEGQVWSCAAAAAEYVLHRWGEGARVYNVATDGIDELLAGRVRWVQGPDEACDAVLTAAPVNRWATPERQWNALQLLRKRGAALIGLCADRVYPSHRGAEFGAGALTTMLAYAADVAPIFCGKPEEVFFRELCDRLGVRPEHCLLLGDNLESDVGGARRVGMASALVLTGVATRADAERAPAERRPDYIVNALTDLA